MAVKLVFVGEGPTELGKEGEYDGFIEIVLKKVLGQRFGEVPVFEIVRKRKWMNLKKHSHTGAKKPRYEKKEFSILHSKRLSQAAALAIEDGADGLIFLIDDDRASITETLLHDLLSIRERYAHFKITAGTALRAVEAALLADKEAVRRVVGDLRYSTNKAVEDVPDPKDVFEKALRVAKKKGIKSREWNRVCSRAKIDIFQQLNLDTVKSECPKGLGRFINEFEEVLTLFG